MHPAFCSSQVVGGVPTPAVEHALRRRTPLIAYAHHPSPVYGRALLFDALKRLQKRHPYVGLAVVGQGTHDEAFWRDARPASWLLVPYLAWVSFAAALNAAAVQLNGPFGA